MGTEMRLAVVIVAWASSLVLTGGCRGRREPPPTPEQRADAKVRAIERLADAMAQDPDGPEARGALEDFRNTPLDARQNSQQAQAIVEVYRQRIEGKYQGFVAQELRMEMNSLLKPPK